MKYFITVVIKTFKHMICWLWLFGYVDSIYQYSF